MDLINKGVQLIRRSTLTSKHRRNRSQDSSSSPPSPTISKTPSITSSITSDEDNLITPGQTPRKNSAANVPTFITITPMISSPPQSPVNKSNFKGNKRLPVFFVYINANNILLESIPIIQNSNMHQIPSKPKHIPDYLSSSPTRASPLSPLPRLTAAAAAAEDGYFSIPTLSDTPPIAVSPLAEESTNEPAVLLSTEKSSVSNPPRSPMKSHFSPRPKHVSRVSTHAVPRARACPNKQRRKLRLDDFVLKRTVGTGSFGRVHLAQSKVNNKHYAIKALDKYDVVRLKQVEHINNEPTILREISHPFLVTLWDAFQDDTHLFMVMDYVPGGELFSILRKQKVSAYFFLKNRFRCLLTLHIDCRNSLNKLLNFTLRKFY